MRELESFVQRALISSSGPRLDFTESDESAPESSALITTGVAAEPTDLRDAERLHIVKVLEATNWIIDGKRGAAKKMGLAPSTLRSKMKRLGIKRTK